MTNETRQRIEAYKKMLPDMRERVVAVAILLVMSISMMASASFAWLTISRNPEVTGVSTSVAANGNLEIALATGTITSAKVPGDSKVGDSSATKGQNVANANLTWGNLVNLSDSSYGLDNLTLRPAQLNQFSLLTSPLYGAVYKGDGRVEKLNSSFGYATWDAEKERFMINNDIGVRAISSVTVEAVGFAQQVLDKRDAAENANLAAGALYYAIIGNSDYMDTLATVMGTYMTASMNSDDESLSNPNIEQEDVINLRDLFEDFIEVYDAQFLAITQLVNYQLFLLNNSETGNTQYTEKTVQNIKETTEAALKSEDIQVSGLDTAKTDYDKLIDGYEKLKILADQGNVKWKDSGLTNIVNSLMNTGKCTLDGTPIENIGLSNASKYLDGKTHTAKITNGVLYNFEQLNGARCSVKGLSVTAKKIINVTIKVNISTTADGALFVSDLEKADILNKGSQGEKVAKDTYGLAVDLWVRTNASNSYLTLEGNVLTKSEMIRATGTDINGNVVELYVVTKTGQETAEDGSTQTISYEVDLYKKNSKNENGQEVESWYNATTHSNVTLEDGETPNAKMVELITVIGFEGENRVWEDNSQLSIDATTQGSGSCYVYYADSPEDQARSLKLLESMNVAFVDDEGTLMAIAIMDTERFYAENGRVTVPLVLQNDSLEVGTDVNGDPIYAITALAQNQAKRITAIVYLDGTKLTNQDVLAASDIQGKLNIQFGSSVTLSHAEDETLLNATRSVSASVSNSNFKYDESIESGTPMTTSVTVRVEGDEPTDVTAFFIRAISSTQGSREEKITFIQLADGSWKGDYTFTAPGNYILRSVELDGQTYDLTDCPTVTVEGFTVNSLECEQAVGRHISVMTAANSSSVDLKLRFASDKVEAMPTTVQGRFLRNSDGTAVNINFTYNAGGLNKGYWTGQATFISSGEYTLEYLVLDGEYARLEESMIQTATVYLGMKTVIYTDSPINFKYDDPEKLTDKQRNLYMKVKIMDNTGKEMEGLENAHLYYYMEGSSLVGFDAPLTWNGSYYTCTLGPVKVGVFKFNKVTVGSNTITYAEESPRFWIMSPNMPSYIDIVEKPYAYRQGGGITMDVKLKDSATATVAALIRDLESQKVYEVQGTLNPTADEEQADNEQIWCFLIPKKLNGKQDGKWQLEAIEIWNYFDDEGNLIYAETDSEGNLTEKTDTNRDDPMLIRLPKEHITKAVTDIKVVIGNDYDVNIGYDDDSKNITAAFLEEQNVTVPAVKFVDFEGEPIGTYENGVFNSYITDVKFVYDYKGDSQTYGGYERTDLVAKDNVLEIILSSSNGKDFEQSGEYSINYAGVYMPKLQYKVNNASVPDVTTSDMGDAAPKIYVWSKSPSVKITATSPSTTTDKAYVSHSTSGFLGRNVTITYTTYAAGKNEAGTIANVCYTASKGDWGVATVCNLTQPTVTITMSEYGNAAGASLAFFDSSGNSAKIYAKNAGTTISQYTWTGNGNCVRYIGIFESNTGNDARTIAGTVTATEIQLTDSSGNVYTVDLGNNDIVINNPY